MKLVCKIGWSMVVVAGLTFSGCTSFNSDATEETSKEIAEPGAGDNSINSVESELLAMILGDFKDGLFRGITLGDPLSKVKITETFELFETEPNFIAYTHDTQQIETVDIYYYHEKGVVNEIKVDVMLNSVSTSEHLFEQMSKYYGSKFQAVKGDSDLIKTWKTGNTIIELEDVSAGIDNGLKLTFKSEVKNHI